MTVGTTMHAPMSVDANALEHGQDAAHDRKHGCVGELEE
jgi:hypothetical protein